MSNHFKLRLTHLSRGAKNYLGGFALPAPPLVTGLVTTIPNYENRCTLCWHPASERKASRWEKIDCYSTQFGITQIAENGQEPC